MSSTTQEDTKFLYTSPSSARAFTKTLLEAYGIPPSHAETIAHCLTLADLRGIDTHGLQRLPPYLHRLRSGALSATASPTLEQITPVVAQVDGHNTFGFLSATLAMERACEMAGEFGIGLVSVKHSNHFGMSAAFVMQANEKGMMSLVFTNSSPALPPWGGSEKLLGVSPIACGAPGGANGGDFVLDMAPSIAARGKVHKALRRGESIPEDWALDSEGKRTTDPAAALEGVMLPMGGPKGSALAIMMDVFSGVLSGSEYAGGVTGPYDKSNKEADVGHFVVAIKPDLFMGLEDFRARMEVLYAKVIGSRKMEGVDRIYFPGEIEQITHRRREKEGIPFVKAEVDALNAEAEKVGVPRLVVSERSLEL